MRNLQSHHRGHPERLSSVKTIIAPAYEALVLRMMQKGIDERETAIIIEQIVQEQLDTMPLQDLSEWEMARVDRMKMPEPEPVPVLPPAPSAVPWMLYGAGAGLLGVAFGAMMFG